MHAGKAYGVREVDQTPFLRLFEKVQEPVITDENCAEIMRNRVLISDGNHAYYVLNPQLEAKIRGLELNEPNGWPA